MKDDELYKLCQKYGAAALEARRKFSGLLPEVFRRKLYEKKGFASIYHFAAVLAGMSRDQVDLVLRLERRFEKMPVLKKALTSGEVSVNKLVRVVSIATEENEAELAEKAKVLPKAALETFVRDEKSLPGQTFEEVALSEEVKSKLAELQERGIDVNEFLIQMIEEYESRDVEEAKSKYISVKTKKIFSGRCSVPNCQKEAKTLHHKLPYSIGKSHDSRYLVPLCAEHHKIAHAGNVKFAEMQRRE